MHSRVKDSNDILFGVLYINIKHVQQSNKYKLTMLQQEDQYQSLYCMVNMAATG